VPLVEFRPDIGDTNCADGRAIAANADSLSSAVQCLSKCGAEFSHRVGFTVGVIGGLFRLENLPAVTG
jgi:hypothetical protein